MSDPVTAKFVAYVVWQGEPTYDDERDAECAFRDAISDNGGMVTDMDWLD